MELDSHEHMVVIFTMNWTQILQDNKRKNCKKKESLMMNGVQILL